MAGNKKIIMRKKNQTKLKTSYISRIEFLCETALNLFTSDSFLKKQKIELSSDKTIALANKYIKTVRKISLKTKTPIPKKYKRFICKHCYSILVPDLTARIRIKNDKIVYYCFNCGQYYRIPIKIKKTKSKN